MPSKKNLTREDNDRCFAEVMAACHIAVPLRRAFPIPTNRRLLIALPEHLLWSGPAKSAFRLTTPEEKAQCGRD